MNATKNDFTEKVLQAYSNIADPRLKFIVAVLIKHLHACVIEMQPTDEEWEFAWDYMRRMAAITGLERNEFLLFADVIGVSQLIETLSYPLVRRRKFSEVCSPVSKRVSFLRRPSRQSLSLMR